jgi:hypothetical protein
MKEYKFRYLDEAMANEVEELLKGEHGSALMTFGFECANAGVEGFKRGCAKGALLVAVGAGAVVGGYKLGKKLIQKRKERQEKEHEHDFVVV